MKICKLLLLLCTFSMPALAVTTQENSLRQVQGAECAKRCAQLKASEDATCRLNFMQCSAKACTKASGVDAQTSASDCNACDVTQAFCLTESNSRLLACEINCLN